MTTDSISIVQTSRVAESIRLIRGHRVMLDEALAELYGVEVRELVQSVKRNIRRFPADFMFQLTADEAQALRSQSVIIKVGRGHHRKYLPYAFTEQGLAMLSGVLHSDRAIEVNIAIMRTFVQLRSMLSSNAELADKLARLEKKYDTQFKVVFDAIRELMAPPSKSTRRIGFATSR
jgi:hypothetical protein